MLAGAELHPSDLLGERAGEVPVHRVGRLLALAARELEDEGELARACAHRLADAWGGWKLAFWAPTPKGVLHRAANAQRYLFPGTRCRLEDVSKHTVRVRIEAEDPEPDLFPVLRRAIWSRLPTLAGLPPFRIAATSSPSVFDVDVREPVPGVGPIFGAVAGFSVALALGTILEPIVPLAGVLVGAGATVGWGWASRRRFEPSPAERTRSVEKLRRLATSVLLYQEEQRQIGARGDAWAERLVADVRRRDRLAREGDAVVDMTTSRQIRSYTHDLRNPLAVVRSCTEILSLQLPDDDARRRVVTRMSRAVGEVETRVARALESLAEASERAEPSLEWIDTEMLTRSIRRRLRALVVGRNLRVSVFRAREAPDEICCERLSLDRALDLLLIRAVDAALEGSIVIEIGGRPGRLAIRLSESGADRAHADLVDLLGAKPAGAAAADSPPLLVDTVDRLGGRLDVTSTRTGPTVSMEIPVTPAGIRRPAATARGHVVRLR